MSSCHLCCRTKGKTWDLKLKIMHWLYIGIKRNMIMYESTVWWLRVGMATIGAEFGYLHGMCNTDSMAES
jgi:cytochrome b